MEFTVWIPTPETGETTGKQFTHMKETIRMHGKLCSTIILFALIISVPAFGATDLPEAFVPNYSHDFQDAVEGETIIRDFIIKNKGTAALVIHDVKTG